MIVQLNGFGRWIAGGGDDMPGVGMQYHATITARFGSIPNPASPQFMLHVGAWWPAWEWSSIEGHRHRHV